MASKWRKVSLLFQPRGHSAILLSCSILAYDAWSKPFPKPVVKQMQDAGNALEKSATICSWARLVELFNPEVVLKVRSLGAANCSSALANSIRCVPGHPVKKTFCVL